MISEQLVLHLAQEIGVSVTDVTFKQGNALKSANLLLVYKCAEPHKANNAVNHTGQTTFLLTMC